jgi:hypothetical protein
MFKIGPVSQLLDPPGLSTSVPIWTLEAFLHNPFNRVANTPEALSFAALLLAKGACGTYPGELGFAVDKIQGKWYVNLR